MIQDCEAWPLSVKKEQRLRVLDNKVLRRIFGLRIDEVKADW
jgi:hypothetical protein